MAKKISFPPAGIIRDMILITAVALIYFQTQTIFQRLDILEKSGNNKIAAQTRISENIQNQSKEQIAPAKKQARIIPVEISDETFSPVGIHISLNELAGISVANRGEKPHSFVIDELDIDSGPIEPGQTKELELSQNIRSAASFTFYSNAEGDDPQIFKGILMVTK